VYKNSKNQGDQFRHVLTIPRSSIELRGFIFMLKTATEQVTLWLFLSFNMKKDTKQTARNTPCRFVIII